eukprot:SAG25_NODE_181_length_12544_cov_32.416472_8_plen_267_part_00
MVHVYPVFTHRLTSTVHYCVGNSRALQQRRCGLTAEAPSRLRRPAATALHLLHHLFHRIHLPSSRRQALQHHPEAGPQPRHACHHLGVLHHPVTCANANANAPPTHPPTHSPSRRQPTQPTTLVPHSLSLSLSPCGPQTRGEVAPAASSAASSSSSTLAASSSSASRSAPLRRHRTNHSERSLAQAPGAGAWSVGQGAWARGRGRPANPRQTWFGSGRAGRRMAMHLSSSPQHHQWLGHRRHRAVPELRAVVPSTLALAAAICPAG